MRLTELDADAIAAQLAERLELVPVANVPAELVEAIADGSTSTYAMFNTGRDAVRLMITRRGHMLDVEWEHDGRRLGAVRFGARRG
jgi:hypothetical protein